MRRRAVLVGLVLAISLVGVGVARKRPRGPSQVVVRAQVAQASSPAAPAGPWTTVALPQDIADRQGPAYVQADDTHLLAYGGTTTTDDGALVVHNDGVLVDLTSGAIARVPGPQVEALWYAPASLLIPPRLPSLWSESLATRRIRLFSVTTPRTIARRAT